MTQVRNIDEDLIDALDHNPQNDWGRDDVATVLAEVPGANDEFDWYWILRHKDGRYIYVQGGCDYTGWD